VWLLWSLWWWKIISYRCMYLILELLMFRESMQIKSLLLILSECGKMILLKWNQCWLKIYYTQSVANKQRVSWEIIHIFFLFVFFKIRRKTKNKKLLKMIYKTYMSDDIIRVVPNWIFSFFFALGLMYGWNAGVWFSQVMCYMNTTLFFFKLL
jgi:hypothetical protein